MLISDFIMTVKPTKTTQRHQEASSNHQAEPCSSLTLATTTKKPAVPKHDSLCTISLPTRFILQIFRVPV